MTRVPAIGALLLLLVASQFARANPTVTLCSSDDQGGPGTNLTQALQIGGHITFSCGGPATILVNCTHWLGADADIDGGGNVTLQGNARIPGCGASVPTPPPTPAWAYAMFANLVILYQGKPLPQTWPSLHLSRLRIIGAKPKPEGGTTTLLGGNVVRGDFNLTLSDVTIANSYAPIQLARGSVTLERTLISNSDRQAIVAPDITIRDHSHLTSNSGSPLESHGGKVTIADSDFTGNKQGSDLSSCTTIDIRNAQFTNNNAGGTDGGALRTACNARIASSTFTGNQANSGGAIYIIPSAAQTTLLNVEFDGNIALSDGGGIAINHEASGFPPLALELQSVTFKGNRAKAAGALSFESAGGTVLNPRTLTGSAVQFIDNQATAFAGALFTLGAQVQLTRSLFMGNRAATAGGALVGIAFGGGQVEISNSIIVKNVAPSGAAFAGNGVTFINTTLADNNGPAVSAMATVPSVTIPPGPTGPQPIRFHNTIVSGGTGNPCGPADPAGPYQDLGNNLQYPANSCGSGIAVGAPQFGPSYIPLPSSPAANAGDDAVCAAVPIAGRDIWDKTRPKGPHCTIGAAESDIQNIIQQGLSPLVRGVSSLLKCCYGRP
jgi:hypothetical protein